MGQTLSADGADTRDNAHKTISIEIPPNETASDDKSDQMPDRDEVNARFNEGNHSTFFTIHIVFHYLYPLFFLLFFPRHFSHSINGFTSRQGQSASIL